MNICLYKKNSEFFLEILKKSLNGDIKLFNYDITNNDNLSNLSCVIIYDYNFDLINYSIKNKITIFSCLSEINGLDKYEYIYFENDLVLVKYLNSYIYNYGKTFSIIIPIYNSYEYLNNSVESVLNQNYKNYNIFLCDDYSSPEELEKIKLYSDIKNIIIYKNKKNIGKFATVNNILDKIKTDFFLILDSDDTITSTRLVLDLIYFGINNKNIYAVRSKYIRIDTNNKIIENGYGHSTITFKTNIINKIGMYYPNRFGSDTEYILRIGNFLGKKSIINYDIVTYNAILRKDMKNLTKIYNKDKRRKFIKFIYNIYNIPNSLSFFIQNKFEDLEKELFYKYYKLNKLKNLYVDKLNLDLNIYKKLYLDIAQFNNEELINHWINIGIIEGRLSNLKTFYEEYPNFNYKTYLKKNRIKFKTKYEVYGWIFLKNKINYIKWLKSNGYIANNYIDSNHKNLINIDDSTKYICLINYINNNNIKYIYVSNIYKNIGENICLKLNLNLYNNMTDKFENTIFLGLYDNYDFYNIVTHFGKKYFMDWINETNIKLNFSIFNMDFDQYNNKKNKLLEKINKYYNIKMIYLVTDFEFTKCAIFN